ncbi:MAG: hypothetical protein FJW30_24320 [Acidobacteria bacterium]|nr:hypothetical protein [Acidobacteriota bacterium]
MRLAAVFFLSIFSFHAAGQKIEVRSAELQYFPGVADSNSPLHWNDGKLYVYNSDGNPLRSEGTNLNNLRNVRATHMVVGQISPWWVEATFRDDDGTLYAWYHHELWDICDSASGGKYLSTPMIGAAVSRDNGFTFRNLGIVLRARPELNCNAENGYFAGGHGDFSVLLDRDRKFFYFLFSNYTGSPSEQGVAVARMAYGDRAEPEGKVFKYHQQAWKSDGIEGPVTPIFPVRVPWESANADAFWGPSVHFNRELGEFVMLLNRACCEPGWPAEGIYVSTNPDLSDPGRWTEPEKVLNKGGWYPMTVGLSAGDTDKEAGGVARMYIGSDSSWEIVFRKGQQGVKPLPAVR